MSVSISYPVDIVHAGQKATLTTMRADGDCWGRIVGPAGEFDVDVLDSAGQARDLYDLPDADALELLDEAIGNGTADIAPAVGYLVGDEP